MAIEIRKLPKWEGAKIDDKLEIIKNFIGNIGFSIISFSLMILTTLVFIADSMLGTRSIGTIKLFLVIIMLSITIQAFSTFFYIRKVK